MSYQVQDPAKGDLIEDLNTLNRIAETLNRAVDVGNALTSALAQLVALMGLETGWIFMHDPAADERWAGKGYRLAAHYNLPPALSVDNPAIWDKGCDCQTLCNRGKLDQAYNEVRCSRLASASGDRRGLAVHASAPLQSGDRILGILNVAGPDWESFSPRTLALLANAGNQIGIAVERAGLYDMLREQRVLEQAALLDLSNQLLSHLDLDELVEYLVEEVRRLLQVDACALLLPGDDPEYLYFRAASGWQSDPVGNGYSVPADERSGSGRVMMTGQPLIVADDKDQPETVPWMAHWLQQEGFRSAVIVPLMIDEQAIGTLVIDTRLPRTFNQAEVRFLQLMANQAAIAIVKARLHHEEIQRHRIEEELAVGRQIQLSMLPARCPILQGWQLCTAYEAARQVGGDFYDFFELPEQPDALGLVIADVSGKGVPAAIFMALCRTAIRSSALGDRPPASALRTANKLIRQDSHSDMFISVFYGILNTETGGMRFANAGHPRPLWWKAEAEEFEELEARGMILGILDEVPLEEREVFIDVGDVVVFFTDGITEAMNAADEEFGLDRLREVIRDKITSRPNASATDVRDAILAAVRSFIGNAPQSDDLTLFVARRDTADGLVALSEVMVVNAEPSRRGAAAELIWRGSGSQ